MGKTTKLRLSKLKYVVILVLLFISVQALVDESYYIKQVVTYIEELFNPKEQNKQNLRYQVKNKKSDKAYNKTLSSSSKDNTKLPHVYKEESLNTDLSSSYQDTIKESVLGSLSSSHNETPIANAGPSQSLEAGEKLILDGSKSFDPENKKLTFHWAIINLPKNLFDFELKNNTQPIVFLESLQPGLYKFSLVVSDGENTSKPDFVEIVVGEGNGLPQAVITGLDSLQPGESLLLSAEDSYDPNNKPITKYRWSLVSGPNVTSNVDVSVRSELRLSDLDEGVYRFSLSVFNGVIWSQQVYKQINVQVDQDLALSISGKTNLLSETTATYKATVSRKLKKNEHIHWFFNYLPENSQSKVSKIDNLKAKFKPDKKGIYILKAIVRNNKKEELASASINIFAAPKVLNENIVSQKLEEKVDKLFISAGGTEYYCSQQHPSVELKGYYGGLNSESFKPRWELVSKPKNSEAYIRSDGNNRFFLDFNNKAGVYKLKFSITNNKNEHLEDIKTIQILHQSLEFNMPNSINITQEILDVSSPQDYGHKVFYGSAFNLFKRKKIKDQTTRYLVFDEFEDEDIKTIVSSDRNLLALKNKTKKEKDLSKYILNSWYITPKKNRKYYLRLKKHHKQDNIFVKNQDDYVKHKYKIEFYPMYDDLPSQPNVVSELVALGEVVRLDKIEYEVGRSYYFNSRPFHKYWHGVLQSEEDITTFEIVKKNINNESCYMLQIL